MTICGPVREAKNLHADYDRVGDGAQRNGSVEWKMDGGANSGLRNTSPPIGTLLIDAGGMRRQLPCIWM